MMTSVINPFNLSDLNIVADAVADLFPREMWGFCGDCIVVSYEDEEFNTLYNVASKLDFLHFSLGMEGHDINFENGPAVLYGMCEAYEMEQMFA